MPAIVQRLRAENERLKAENERLRDEHINLLLGARYLKNQYEKVAEAIGETIGFVMRKVMESKDESMRRRGRVTLRTAQFMTFGTRVCEMLEPEYEERLRQLFHREFGVYPESLEGTQLVQNETYLPSSDEEREPDPED